MLIIGFKKWQESQNNLVWSALPQVNAEGRFKLSRGKKRSCGVYKSVNETFDIRKGPLNYNSDHVIYLFKCKQCQCCFPYVAITKTKFRYRINNCKWTHRKFRKKYVEKDLLIVIKKIKLKQNLFHENCSSESHQGIKNWSVTLIDQVKNLASGDPNDLYISVVHEAYNWVKKGKTFLEKDKFLHSHTHENIPMRTF